MAEGVGALEMQPRELDHNPHALVGRALPPWQVAAWANGSAPLYAELGGKVVVVRFWTDACPHCEASMPALQALSQQFVDDEVLFVGLYHAKPQNRDGPEAWRAARALAGDWGIRFPLGHDAGWRTLRSWWLSNGEPRATSATLVLGKSGKVIHVHPGPRLFPSEAPSFAQENHDYLMLLAAIRRGLEE